MTSKVYYIIPTNDKGDFTWDKVTSKNEAVSLAKHLFNEQADKSFNFQVNVFVGDNQSPFTHFDPVFTVKE